MGKWIASIALMFATACSTGTVGSTAANEVGVARSGDAELVCTHEKGIVRLFIRKGGSTSLVLPLVIRADVDQALRMIDTGMSSAQNAKAGEEIVLAKMNTGRPEARMVTSNPNSARVVHLVIANRPDTAPAPAFAFEMTAGTRREVDAVLAKSKALLTR